MLNYNQFNPYLQQYNQQQQMLMPPYQPQQSVGGIDYTIQVSGKESAYQYCQKMGPNCTSPAMFDTTNIGIMYIGRTDSAGTPSIEAFDFVPHVEKPEAPAIDPTQYVSRTEFQGIADQVQQLKEAINGIHGQSQATAVPTTNAASTGTGPVAAG